MKKASASALILLLLLGSLFFVFPWVGEANINVSAAANVQVIDSCGVVINESGYYVLSGDLNAGNTLCIWVNTSNVVIDGNGSTINEEGGQAIGIARPPGGSGIRNNVTVKNLKIVNASSGIILMNAANVTVDNTTFWNVSDYSIYSLNSSEVHINNTVQELGPTPKNFLFVNNGESITLENTRAGAYEAIVNVTNTEGLRILNTHAEDSRRMLVATNSSEIEVTGVTSNEVSITVVEIRDSSNVTLRNDVFTRDYADNGPGISITNTEDVLIDNVTIENYDLLIIIANSSNITVTNSNFPKGEQSAGIGLQVANSTGIAINSNSYQKDQPIRIFNSSNIELTGNTMLDTLIGIHIELSQNISIMNNFIADIPGGKTGINITDSRFIAIENNNILNFSAGIFAINITDTSIADNTIAFSNATAGNIDFSTGGILIEGLSLLGGGGPSGNNNTPNTTTVQGLLGWIFSSISALQIQNVNVTGNVVYGENYEPGATGILLVATPRTVLVANNTVRNFGMGIVGLLTNGTKVVDNTISDIKSNVSWSSEFFVPGAIAFGVSANASVEENHIRNSTVFLANALSAHMNTSKNRAIDGEYGLIVVFSNLTTISSNYISNTTFALMTGYLFNGLVYNNLFNSSNGTNLFNSSITWNVSKTRGFNIVGGPYLGGNFWANPNGTGFSETCNDTNEDGICDTPYQIDANNTDYLPLAVPPSLPDLRISGLSGILIDPTQNIYNVTITVENAGTRDAGPFNVTLLDNGTEIWNSTVGNLSAGEGITLSFTRIFSQGIHELTAIADPGYPNDSVIESNESNNEKSLILIVGEVKLPDLYVDSITAPAFPVNGSPITVNVTVSNIGDWNASAFNVTLYVNSTSIGTQTVDSLGIGESITLNFLWTPPTPGLYNLTAVADPQNSVIEHNESNNERTSWVQVVRAPTYIPDLWITNGSAPERIAAGSEAMINVTVGNYGNITATNVNVSLFINGEFNSSAIIPLLPVNASQNLTFNWTPKEAGTYVVEVIVDPGNLIPEANESNNNWSTEILVYPVNVTTEKPNGYYGKEAFGALFDLWNLWTTWFFLNYNRFQELYQKAQEAGVDEAILKNASELNETATGLIKEAWKTDNLHQIRTQIWKYVKSPVLWYKAREAYLAEKKAVELLLSALKH